MTPEEALDLAREDVHYAARMLELVEAEQQRQGWRRYDPVNAAREQLSESGDEHTPEHEDRVELLAQRYREQTAAEDWPAIEKANAAAIARATQERDAAEAALAAAEAAAHAQQVTVPEAAEQLGTSMDELATAQEVVEVEEVKGVLEILAEAEAEDTAEATVHEQDEQAEIAMFDLASVSEIVEAGNAEDAERAEMESARAARAAQLAAYYAPHPEMPGTEPGHGFEREM